MSSFQLSLLLTVRVWPPIKGCVKFEINQFFLECMKNLFIIRRNYGEFDCTFVLIECEVEQSVEAPAFTPNPGLRPYHPGLPDLARPDYSGQRMARDDSNSLCETGNNLTMNVHDRRLF